MDIAKSTRLQRLNLQNEFPRESIRLLDRYYIYTCNSLSALFLLYSVPFINFAKLCAFYPKYIIPRKKKFFFSSFQASYIRAAAVQRISFNADAYTESAAATAL